MRDKEIIAGLVIFGFIGGWLCGEFLAMWAYLTLFAREQPREIVSFVCCALLACGLFMLVLLKKKKKENAHCCRAMMGMKEWARRMSDRLVYVLVGGIIGWIISGQFLK